MEKTKAWAIYFTRFRKFVPIWYDRKTIAEDGQIAHDNYCEAKDEADRKNLLGVAATGVATAEQPT